MGLSGIQIFKLTPKKTVKSAAAQHVWLSP